jgi:hypothetical protein
MAARTAYSCERENVAHFLQFALIALLVSASLANAVTFSVTNNADSGAGSLRRMIRDANLAPGADVITFSLRGNARTILIQSPLPRITNAVVIDASTQPGVKLVGPGSYIGLEVDAPKTTIRGIAIENFEQGIRIVSGRNGRVEACSIIGNSLWGIGLEGGSNHMIISNVISQNRIGISDGFGSRGTNYIRSNFIGTDASGTSVLGNLEYGIWGAGYSQLVIGGPEAGQGNVISGNGIGIDLKLFGEVPSLIQGNFIGTDRTGTLPLGNAWGGLNLIGGYNHVGGVEAGAGNIIAFNGGPGLSAEVPTWIQGNRIFSNSELGIEDAGTHYPVLSYAFTSPSSTLITGTLRGIPQTTYRIEFFASDACDPSGFGEGQRFLGFTTATVYPNGRVPFTFDFPEALSVPSVVTATGTSAYEGTSHFSPCRGVLSPESVGLSVWQTDHPDPASLRSNITYSITISNAGPSRATNVVLENVFPDQARFGLAWAQPSQGSCSHSLDRIICSLGGLDAGASASATVTVQPFFAGYYTNKVTVTSDSPEGSLADNVSEEVTTVGLADLGLTFTMGSPPFRAGEPFAVTLHITNAGPAMAERAEISAYGWYNVSVSPSRIVITNLEAGGSRDIVVSAVPLSDAYFSLYAQIYGSFLTDPIATNNSASEYAYAELGRGVLTLERESYAIQEDGKAILRVIRVGGSEGRLSAAYTTSNGTAIASSDYVPTTGELIFPPGKTEADIVLPAVADETPECNEFFAVNLFSADDATTVGPRSTALVSIAERPPNLAGYIRPVTISATNPRLLVGSQSWPVRLSADGRKVIFTTYAAEIVDPPLASGTHVFMRDLDARTTVQLSPNQTNAVQYFSYHSPTLSGNGKVAAFAGSYWSNGYYSELIVQDIASGSNLIASTVFNSQSIYPVMLSSNGTTVVLSDSSNHLYAIDLVTRSNHLVSAAHDGTLRPDGYATASKVSDDGRFVLFLCYARLLTNDLNAAGDLYLRDLVTHATRLATVDTNGLAVGSSGGGDMSGDGRWVTFDAYARGLAPDVSGWNGHIYVRDMLNGATRLVSTNISMPAYYPNISADGRFIAYQIQTVIGERTDIFLHDAQSRTTALVTRSCSGRAHARYPYVSGDGRFVFFVSSDIDFGDGEFLPNDDNIFRWDRLTDETTLISVNKARTGGARGWQGVGALSHDGNVVAFISDSPDLAFGDNNAIPDVFVWQAGTLPRLNISFTNQRVRITWPIDSPGAVLETRTPQSGWAPVNGPIQQQDGQYSYEATPDGAPTSFFQLRVL